MRSLLASVTLILAFAVLVSARRHHREPPHIKEAKEACYKELEITREEVRNRKKNGEYEKEDCFGACVNKKIGLIDDNGNIDKEVAKDGFPPHVSEENATKIVEACFEPKGKNDCETTVLYKNCVKKLVPRPPMHREMHKVHNECKEKLKLSDEDIEKLRNSRDEAKEDCFVACIGQAIGFLHGNGTLNKEVLLQKAPPHVNKEDAEKVAIECATEEGANECETAVRIHNCFKKNNMVIGHHYGPPPPPPEDD